MNKWKLLVKEAAAEMGIDYEIVRYGTLVELSSILDIAAALLIALLIGRFTHGLLFVAVFSFLRVYCGGYHCKTVAGCACLYTAIVISGILSSTHFISQPGIAVSVFSCMYLFCVCPAEHENNPLSREEYRRDAFIVKVRLFIVMAVYLYLVHSCSVYQGTTAAVLIWLTVLCIMQKRKEKDNEKNTAGNLRETHGSCC